MLGYELVWGETTLDKHCKFGDFVDAHSISRPAAVGITAVTVESRLRYEGETFLQRQQNDFAVSILLPHLPASRLAESQGVRLPGR